MIPDESGWDDIPLDTRALFDAAARATGLSDWGDDSFSERFGLAVDLLKRAGMGEAGDRAAARNCMWLLTTRLQFFGDFARLPIGDEVIERPLLATGEPRSGTTLLHALLSVDPHARALRFWELMYPSPPPGLAGPGDGRRARADADWHEINARMPFWLKSHPYNDMLGDGLPECERTWAFDFRALTPTAWWRVPFGTDIGSLPKDIPAQYRIHRMMLQHGQYARPRKYWVLKGWHGTRLKKMFDAYPDARLVWAHRDPVQVIASAIKLHGELIEGMTGHVDWAALAAGQMRMSRANYAAILSDPMVDDPRIHHIRYRDFVADPVGTIRGFYAFAGKPFPLGTEQAMRDYLAANKGDRYGKFTYSTDLIGEDVEALHREFAPYRERFGVVIEKRG